MPDAATQREAGVWPRDASMDALLDAGAELVCAPDAGLSLFERRIAPLLSAERPHSCNQCHLSGIDLGLFVGDDPCETLTCLSARGLVDLDTPEDSQLLRWIARAKPDSALITQAVIDAEYEAVRAWLVYHARCGESACGPQDAAVCEAPMRLVGCPVDAPRVPGADPGDCSDLTLERLFSERVFTWRNRCYPCHFEQDRQVPIAPKWIDDTADSLSDDRETRCHEASLATLRTIVRRGYIDLSAPERSLLLLKPLSIGAGGVLHGGHDKFEGLDDPAYRDFRLFLERYAACADENANLPRPERMPAPQVEDDDAGVESPVYGYCNCMLVHCHDDFHATFGDADADAIAGCRIEALAVPSVGEPAVDGHSLECRLHYCQLADRAAGACEAALGGSPCQ